ncbi:MAG TPA: agmatine deiminase family protein [Bdellovibrionales bacterium]|nr:agmatine deiminase family protein [Bdellovibrionales bacterium]
MIEIPGARSGFWTRDGFPIPVWNKTDGMDLVNARYYHGFEPDRDIAGKFGARLRDHAYYFEGGNFMVNDLGDCLTIDNDLSSDIPIEVFMDTYGCARTIRLTHLKGIGHADESVRFLKSKVVVTDTPDYVGELEHSGFEVLELPRPSHPYETYVNSLLVNDTVFVPVFNEPSDEQALDVYRGQGLNVVPVETIELANEGLGSIHCITMTYPNVPFATLLRQLGAREL